MPEIIIAPATAHDVIDLRHAVLREGLPREAAIFPGDAEPTARHFVARDGEGKVVGCVTLHLNEWQGEAAFQLRGMAVDPKFQSRGIGAMLLRAIENSLHDDAPTQLLWCNARTPAEGFYLKHGWQSVSAPFDIPTAGPHVKMVRRV